MLQEQKKLLESARLDANQSQIMLISFQAIDIDGDGFISLEEMQAATAAAYNQFDDDLLEKLRLIFEYADENQDGEIALPREV